MQNPDSFGKPHRSRRSQDRLVLWLTIFLSVASLIVAGALGAAVRTGGTGQHFVFGEIEDFGSIVVNGVHYDETRANIIINGVPNQSRSALKLGMMVAIEGELDYALGTGTASVVRTNRSMLGQVEDVNVANGEIRVLSQRVAIDPRTRLDGIAGLSQLAAGDWVAVHGLNDPARNLFAATLVESTPLAGAAIAEIRGNVSNAHSGRFRINGLDVISNARVENGDFVAVKGTYSASETSLLATEVLVTAEIEVEEHSETEIEGFIADFRSPGSFTINGITVDANSARFSGGTAKDLKPGVRITVEGTVRNGVLVAEEIEFDDDEEDSGSTSSATGKSVELEGRISEFQSIDDFVVKGRRIDASNAKIRYKRYHTPAIGQKAHVKGKTQEDGSILASSVKFEKG